MDIQQLKKQYTLVAIQQKSFLDTLIKNRLDGETQEEFEARNFGLTNEELTFMYDTKKEAGETMDKLLSTGITMTVNEIINGFEGVL